MVWMRQRKMSLLLERLEKVSQTVTVQ